MSTNGMRLIYRIQLLVGWVFVVVVVLVFTIGTLLAALAGPHGDLEARHWVGPVVLLIATIISAEFARFAHGLLLARVRPSILDRSPRTPWPRIGLVASGLSLPLLALLLLPLLFMLAVMCFALAESLRAAWPGLTVRFYVVLTVMLTYFFARERFVTAVQASLKSGSPDTDSRASWVDRIAATISPAAQRFAGFVRARTPSYELRDRSIVLDLKQKRLGPSGREPAIVRIDFDELEEVRVLQFAETGPYLRQHVGPDPGLAARAIVDRNRFLIGQIARPSVYTADHGVGPRLVLRGPELFYLVPIANDDPEAVERAFRGQRSAVP